MHKISREKKRIKKRKRDREGEEKLFNAFDFSYGRATG